MYANLKAKVLGNYVKIFSINLKTSSGLAAKLNKNVNAHKLDNNIIRAKNKINDLALANDFRYFVTITCNPKYDRFDLDRLIYQFRSIIRIMRQKENVSLKYLIVPEQHKDGAWHLHGFFTEGLQKYLFINGNGYQDIQYLNEIGYINVSAIKNQIKCSSYVTKYVSKNLADGIKKYRHCYFASTGLATGYEDLNIIYDNEFFNQKFFDFRNDYCFIKTITIAEYEKLKPIIQKMN